MTGPLFFIAAVLTILLVLPFWHPEPSFVILAWVFAIGSAMSEGQRRHP